MRVAVHFRDHPVHGTATVAYLLGRIEDGVHNAPPGFDPISVEQFAENVAARARQDPDMAGGEVVIERLVDNGDDTGSWIPADEFDEALHVPHPPGQVRGQEFRVEADVADQSVESGS